MLLGAGGFATASLAPDAAAVPVQQITEAVTPLPLQAQADLLDTHTLNLYRSESTRSTDTADTLLRRLGIDDPLANTFLRSNPVARQSLWGRSGRNITAEVSADNRLLKLSARWTADDSGNFKRLVVQRTADGFTSAIETAPLVASTRLAGGTIQSSLFAATDDARIPDAVAVQVAEIFSGDIDFHRALRKGDRFSIVYETLEADGEPMRSGRVLSAEFVNNGKTFQAMWFQEPGAAATVVAGAPAGKGAYYTLDGQSLRKSFLVSPLEFSRVTSGFKMRFHPLLQKWRAHLGVDYAAPTGTPVRSVGDGVVDFAGIQGGFGKVVFVKHRNNNTTVYGHLSRIDVKPGQAISQSQVIGAVGATGWATGPHLHFEFRVNGVHHDPLTIVKQSDAVPVTTASRVLFDQQASASKAQLAAAASMRLVTTE
ncbi:MAG: M23 family metallopeptidase [Rhodoferax sp.]|jgi:murein DD-endopeptidase MepM/ murein hydrolase activator NlpD|nr:M23 family metallopeptidase [Rhodoferax sp.]